MTMLQRYQVVFQTDHHALSPRGIETRGRGMALLAEFLREKGKGDPRYLIPMGAPLEPEPEPLTVMDIIRNQYDKILGRKPED